MLGGYTRLTYSLVVIMLETTSSINVFVPMTIGIMTARGIAQFFTRSLYDRAIRMKQMPVLQERIHPSQVQLEATKIMTAEPVVLTTIADMESLRNALMTTHSCFPVYNTANKFVGLVARNIVIRLLEHKAFYDRSGISARGT